MLYAGNNLDKARAKPTLWATIAVWLAISPMTYAGGAAAAHLRAGDQAPAAHPAHDPAAHAGAGRVATARNVALTRENSPYWTAPRPNSVTAAAALVEGEDR
jgi:hypothetical protein